MKDAFCVGVGAVGSIVASMFGGWTAGLTTLVIFMGIDYITGLLCAAVFHNSKKTETGTLESSECYKGLIRKGIMLLIVLAAYRLDLLIGSNYIRDGVCIAFTANELISIVENCGLMGVPIPAVITNAIDILKKQDANSALLDDGEDFEGEESEEEIE